MTSIRWRYEASGPKQKPLAASFTLSKGLVLCVHIGDIMQKGARRSEQGNIAPTGLPNVSPVAMSAKGRLRVNEGGPKSSLIRLVVTRETF